MSVLSVVVLGLKLGIKNPCYHLAFLARASGLSGITDILETVKSEPSGETVTILKKNYRRNLNNHDF